MALNPLNSSNLEQLVLKGLMFVDVIQCLEITACMMNSWLLSLTVVMVLSGVHHVTSGE